MARIRALFPSTSNGRAHHTEVDCSWQVVTDPAGNRLLQLSTYGSDDRQSQPKVSQTVQVDRVVAVQLRRLLDETFGL